MDARPEELEAARRRVVEASHQLAAAGLVVGSGGNVSERVGDMVAVTATGARLESIDRSQVVIVDLEGGPVNGELAPTSELQLHLGIYRRYGAGAVVHTHAPMATALACVLDELPCVHYQLLLLGGAIPVASYRTFGTRELAEVTLAALEGKRAALMANHGSIVHGPTLAEAVENARLLEWGCTVYWRAAVIGRPRLLDEDLQQRALEAAAGQGYGSAARG